MLSLPRGGPLMIKQLRNVLTLFLTLFALSASQLHAITLALSAVPGGTMKFTGTGDRVEFVDSTSPAFFGYDFWVTFSDQVGATSVGLPGNITGVFTIGAITPSGTGESAPVTGLGAFSIFDGSTT